MEAATAKRKATRPRWVEAMGVTEVAAELGVRTSNLDRVAHLPEPVQELASGRLWRAADIKRFAAKRKRAK